MGGAMSHSSPHRLRHQFLRHAFTLVELLVVIGIISLLVSILLPTLARARAAANSVACLSNLRQWSIAFRMYTDANKGKSFVYEATSANETFIDNVRPYYAKS